MKTEDAIIILRRIQDPEPRELLRVSREADEALGVAIEALEKQIPMKPLPEEMDVFGKTIKPCGFCGDDPGKGYYCQWCGQMIKK